MAKPKRIAAVFHPGISRGAFWPGAVAETEEDAPKADIVSETSSDMPSDVAKGRSPKPLHLRKIFNEMVTSESARTKFARERIEYYLPAEMRALFKTVTSVGARLPYDEMGQKLVEFVRNNIYGVLPDYTSPATPEQADGFVINGRKIDINMAPSTVLRQMRELTEIQKIDPKKLSQAAEIKLVDHFSIKDIRAVTHSLSNGNAAVSRRLVANLLVVAAELN